MKLGRREERFAHRVLVIATLALVIGIGVVVLKESNEIEKLIEPSIYRDILFLIGPFAALSMTGYSLASKTFSSGGLRSEFLALLGSYALFMAVALPSFKRREIDSHDDCRFWYFWGGCDELSVRDHRITLVFLVLAAVLILMSFFRAKIFRLDEQNLPTSLWYEPEPKASTPDKEKPNEHNAL